MDEDFETALRKACGAHYGNWLYGGGFKRVPKDDVESTLKDIQKVKKEAETVRRDAKRIMRDARAMGDRLRLLHSPMLRRVTETLERGVLKGLVCPECGEGDKGNKKNRKSWCFKCDVPLVKPGQAAKWVNVKVKRGKGLDDDIIRKLRGLPDKEKLSK